MIFKYSNSDNIRRDEDKHEAELKQLLSDYGIDYEVTSSLPFGIRRQKRKHKSHIIKEKKL
ncbi:MAG: hypothetical protein LBO69_06130 [Ignavibacteria bacterium]|jgi:hypothetical protein|nr:hypothetical protein [Ignavibacteria bacterium]